VEQSVTPGGASAASILIYNRADPDKFSFLIKNQLYVVLIQHCLTQTIQTTIKTTTAMDILYETVSLPKPEKRKKTNNKNNNKSYSGLKMNSEKNKIKNLLVKFNIFGSDRMRRDSTTTTITAITMLDPETIRVR
jgi:hypothetical protein